MKLFILSLIAALALAGCNGDTRSTTAQAATSDCSKQIAALVTANMSQNAALLARANASLIECKSGGGE